jgi:hypothetical protein
MRVVARARFEPHRDKSQAAGHFALRPTNGGQGILETGHQALRR